MWDFSVYLYIEKYRDSTILYIYIFCVWNIYCGQLLVIEYLLSNYLVLEGIKKGDGFCVLRCKLFSLAYNSQLVAEPFCVCVCTWMVLYIYTLHIYKYQVFIHHICDYRRKLLRKLFLNLLAYTEIDFVVFSACVIFSLAHIHYIVIFPLQEIKTFPISLWYISNLVPQ